MAYAAYLLENEILLLSRVGAGEWWPLLELTEPLNYQVRCCYVAQNALKLYVENNDTKEQYFYCMDNFFCF